MRTIVPYTRFACRYYHACVCCLHECLVCATMSVRPAAGATIQAAQAVAAAMPARMQCTFPPSPASSIPGLEPPG